MKTIRWSDLDAAERSELHNLITSKGAGDAWSPSTDWLGFMLLALPAAIAGTIAIGMTHGFGTSVGAFDFVSTELETSAAITMFLHRFLFVVPLALAIWLAVFLIRNWKRRGYAVTSFATIRVAGPKLKLIRHDEVTRVACRVIRSRRSASFTVFELFDRRDAKFTCLTHRIFADAAIAAINRTRREPVPVSMQ